MIPSAAGPSTSTSTRLGNFNSNCSPIKVLEYQSKRGLCSTYDTIHSSSSIIGFLGSVHGNETKSFGAVCVPIDHNPGCSRRNQVIEKKNNVRLEIIAEVGATNERAGMKRPKRAIHVAKNHRFTRKLSSTYATRNIELSQMVTFRNSAKFGEGIFQGALISVKRQRTNKQPSSFLSFGTHLDQEIKNEFEHVRPDGQQYWFG